MKNQTRWPKNFYYCLNIPFLLIEASSWKCPNYDAFNCCYSHKYCNSIEGQIKMAKTGITWDPRLHGPFETAKVYKDSQKWEEAFAKTLCTSAIKNVPKWAQVIWTVITGTKSRLEFSASRGTIGCQDNQQQEERVSIKDPYMPSFQGSRNATELGETDSTSITQNLKMTNIYKKRSLPDHKYLKQIKNWFSSSLIQLTSRP